MKLLTKQTDYAIRALADLAKEREKFVSVREVALRQTIPYAFLRRIFQTLIQEKYVESKEGTSGGVRLLKHPREVHIVDLIDLFQGHFGFSECLIRKKICPHRPTCLLRKELSRIEETVDQEFRKLTLAQLIYNGKERR